MTGEVIKGVPEPTLRRLPLYLHYLRTLQASGRPVVSASHMGSDLQLDATQVRKDLAATGVVGRPKIGFEVEALVRRITEFLGFNNVKDAVLVGAGHLGRALLEFERFNRYGLNIVAAFDNDPAKIGQCISDKPIYALEKLPDLAQRLRVQLGILTVPAEAAQSCTDLLVAGGVQALWNFAPVTLETPAGVIVQNEDLFASLAVLSNKLVEAATAAG
jgi:redox-sensing transcriptional repressor